MKRNSEALTSYDEIIALEDFHDDEEKAESDAKEVGDNANAADDDFDPSLIESSRSEILHAELETVNAPEDESIPFEELDDGGDEWARAFVWEDGESIVAR